MEENDFGFRIPSDRIQLSCVSDVSDVFLSFSASGASIDGESRREKEMNVRNPTMCSSLKTNKVWSVGINDDGIEHKANSTLRIKDSGEALLDIS